MSLMDLAQLFRRCLPVSFMFLLPTVELSPWFKTRLYQRQRKTKKKKKNIDIEILKIWNPTLISFVGPVSKMTASRSGIHHVDDTPLQIMFLTSFQVHSAASQAVNNQVGVSVRAHSFRFNKNAPLFNNNFSYSSSSSSPSSLPVPIQTFLTF